MTWSASVGAHTSGPRELVAGESMLSKVAPEHYGDLKRDHREALSRYPLINAVMSGLQDGWVYAHRGTGTVVVCTKSGFSLVETGAAPSVASEAILEHLIATREIPAYVHLYSPGPALRAHIATSCRPSRTRRRAQFWHDGKTPSHADQHPVPRGYRLAAIQDGDFDRMETVFQLHLGHRYWNSKEHFRRQAIGACMLDEHDSPVAICYSACVVDGVTEADTLVVPEHRGRGLARLVAQRFCDLAMAHGLTPHWDSFVANTPSCIVAQTLGLTPIQEYDLVSLPLR